MTSSDKHIVLETEQFETAGERGREGEREKGREGEKEGETERERET